MRVYLSCATMAAGPAVTRASSCPSYAGKAPTEIMADRGVQNPSVNLEQAYSDFSKT